MRRVSGPGPDGRAASDSHSNTPVRGVKVARKAVVSQFEWPYQPGAPATGVPVTGAPGW
jgi:hypothetical protein